MSKHEVNQEAVALIKKSITGVDTGVFSETEKGSAATQVMGLYEVTDHMLNQTNRFLTGLNAAATQAVGEVAIDAMVKDADLKSVSGDFHVPHMGSISVSVERERANTIKPELGPTKGSTTNKMEFVANKGNSGQLKVARDAIKALAKEKL